MAERTDSYHLGLGANEAAADANDPEAGGVSVGASATVVSRRMNVRGKEFFALYIRTSGTGVVTINMNGSPLKADHPLVANAPLAALVGNPVAACGMIVLQ